MQQNIDWSLVKRNDLGHWADETGISYQSLERCAWGYLSCHAIMEDWS